MIPEEKLKEWDRLAAELCNKPARLPLCWNCDLVKAIPALIEEVRDLREGYNNRLSELANAGQRAYDAEREADALRAQLDKMREALEYVEERNKAGRAFILTYVSVIRDTLEDIEEEIKTMARRQP